MNKKLRIATWNIGSLLQDYDKNSVAFFDTIRRDKPDVLFVQEFPSSTALINELMTVGGFQDYFYLETSKTHIKDGWSMGIGIFSVKKLSDRKILPLTPPTEEIYYNGKQEFWHAKYFLKAAISVCKKKLTVVTGHGFPFYRYHLKEAEHIFVYHEIEEFIKENTKESDLCMIGADFNAHDPMRLMPFFTTTHMDIFQNVPTRPSGRKTDAVIIPKTFSYDLVLNTSVDGFDHHYLSTSLSF